METPYHKSENEQGKTRALVGLSGGGKDYKTGNHKAEFGKRETKSSGGTLWGRSDFGA